MQSRSDGCDGVLHATFMSPDAGGYLGQIKRGMEETMTPRSTTAGRKNQQPSATRSHQETLFSNNHQQHVKFSFLLFLQGKGQHLHTFACGQ